MWNNLMSVFKKIDFASFICEETCRHCGRAVTRTAEREMNLVMETPAAALIHAQLKTGPPGTCLCTQCSAILHSNRQSVCWLPYETCATASGAVSPASVPLPTAATSDHPSTCASAGARHASPGCSAANSGSVVVSPAAVKLLPVSTAGMYEGPLQKLIRRLKYDDDRLVVTDISPLMISAFQTLSEALPQLADDSPLIVPIPLHASRQLRRGYNQAALLAKGIAQFARLPIAKKVLIRKKKTRPQYGLGKTERLANIEGAFCLGDFDVRGKSVILVDDVFTSGATLTSCASLLTAGGAKCVAAIAAARAPYDKGGR